jgi:hypothetical protein
MAGDNEYVSKAPYDADLNVLCIDGTRATDSAAFFSYVYKAGLRMKLRQDRVAIQNLLSLVGGEPRGSITGPDNEDRVYPFGPEHMKTLPIKKMSVAGGRQRVVDVLLLQGEVTGDKTTFSDPVLGSTHEARLKAAMHNSNLLKRLCLAPGVADPGTASGHLDFSTARTASTDILYLSGHGSMAGTLSGEAEEYMRFFDLSLLLKQELVDLARTDLVPPLWMVLASCFGMRPTLAEIWLRVFNNQRLPLRGILGYQTTSPLADASVEINRRFANALAEKKTFIRAWQEANGNNDRWTALAFDYAENDTLTSLRDLKRGRTPFRCPPAPERKLYFHTQGQQQPKLVQIEPPAALLEVHHWDSEDLMLVGDTPEERQTTVSRFWDKTLITNLDFTEASFKAAAAASNGKYVSNGSWRACAGQQRMVDSGSWRAEFCPGRIYAVVLFPPFAEPFKDGFKPGDEVELSLVHVRHDYRKPVTFLDVLQPVSVNGRDDHYDVAAADPTSSKPSRRVRNTVRFRCPTAGAPFEPARISVRYRRDAASQHYLWFWFAVKIQRDGATVFDHDFDTFIITAGAHHCTPTTPADPLPEVDVWRPM